MPRAPFYTWRLGGSKPENAGCVRPEKTDTMTARRAMAAAPGHSHMCPFPRGSSFQGKWTCLSGAEGSFQWKDQEPLGWPHCCQSSPGRGTHRCATPLHAPWPQAGSPSSTASAYGSLLPTSHTAAATSISSTENRSRRAQKHTALEDGQEGWLTGEQRLIAQTCQVRKPKSQAVTPRRQRARGQPRLQPADPRYLSTRCRVATDSLPVGHQGDRRGQSVKKALDYPVQLKEL